MITDNQINNLQPGDKLIFYRHGGVLSAGKNNVFTFAKWWKSHFGKNLYWQSQELLDMGNLEHNFAIYDTELFDENIHDEANIMDAEKIRKGVRQFISKWGD